MLLEIEKENEQLVEENARLRAQVKDRLFDLDNVGTLADASLRMEKLFSTAQKAVDTYLANVRHLGERQMEASREKVEETRRLCLAFVQKTEDALAARGGGVLTDSFDRGRTSDNEVGQSTESDTAMGGGTEGPSLSEQVEGWFREILEFAL